MIVSLAEAAANSACAFSVHFLCLKLERTLCCRRDSGITISEPGACLPKSRPQMVHIAPISEQAVWNSASAAALASEFIRFHPPSMTPMAFLLSRSWVLFQLLVLLLIGIAQKCNCSVQVHAAGGGGDLEFGKTDADGRLVHIVYMGSKRSEDDNPTELEQHHLRILSSVHVQSSLESGHEVGSRLHHSYNRAFNGFSASLSPEEVITMSGMPGVVSVFPSRIRTISTTRSWQFMGLDPSHSSGLWSETHFGRGVIIGLLDSGIWPESRSFHDESMPPVPARWRGICQNGDQNFNSSTCNKKVIGARYFVSGFEAQIGAGVEPGYLSPRDQNGHGTHTSSTAAGRLVTGVDLFGLAGGNATGGAPLAHIAMYKVCWPVQPKSINSLACTDADILAGWDAAIADGVDVISISLNQMLGYGNTPSEYSQDAIAVGAFHAAQKGIFVAASGGNDARPGSVTNVSPWLTTVAASTIDRRFPATVSLGNNASYPGIAINDKNQLTGSWYPLVYGGDTGSDDYFSSLCYGFDLHPAKVKGNIIYCKSDAPGYEPYAGPVQAGAVGMIWPLENSASYVEASAFDIPTSLVTSPNAQSDILDYIHNTMSPQAKIEAPFTELYYYPSPIMSSFSSKGPNALQPQILKPDVTAPGVNILAAWSPNNPPTMDNNYDNRSVDFNILSGTSMSTPHVAGAAALIKSLHPTWSAAAIRSSLMTTATLLDKRDNPIQDKTGAQAADHFAFGSGHISPNQAADPGLVYDITPEEYSAFLCGIGYNQFQVTGMTGNSSFRCPVSNREKRDASPYNLNYPTITIPNLGWSWPKRVVRTLTLVGDATGVTYNVQVQAPVGVNVSVVPDTLTFARPGDRASYTASFSPTRDALPDRYVFGALVWTDGGHHVRTPVVVRVQNHTRPAP